MHWEYEDLQPFEGSFRLGINLSDSNWWYPCWNLALQGYLWSPDFMSPLFTDKFLSNRDLEINTLRYQGCLSPTNTPRAMWYLMIAAQIRRGQSSDKVNNLSHSQKNTILKLSDIELEFEEKRRLIVPQAASRLSCFWITEADGQDHIFGMLGKNTQIVKVTVPLAKRVSKVDTRWFDAYVQKQELMFIEKYWEGTPFVESSKTYEILIEGSVCLETYEDQDKLKTLCKPLVDKFNFPNLL